MWGTVRNQLRSVIEWTKPLNTTVFEKWTTSGDEIKNASKLIIGPGQGCIFVYEGKVQAVHTQSGIVNLQTDNIPFVTTLTKFMQAFVSEHKVGLYFFKTSQLVDLKWGTPSVVKYEDPQYHFPVGLRAFGNFSVQIQNPDFFFQQIVAAQDIFTTDDLRELLSSRIIQPMTDVFAHSAHTYTAIDAHRNELAAALTKVLNQDFNILGFNLMDFRIEGTTFDEDTMKRINRIADMTAESQAAGAAGVSYIQLQQLQALRDAAKNPGGAGMVMGIGVGMGLGQQIGGLAAGAQQGSEITKETASADDVASRLKKINDLFTQGLITKDEFEMKRKEILEKL